MSDNSPRTRLVYTDTGDGIRITDTASGQSLVTDLDAQSLRDGAAILRDRIVGGEK